MAVVIEGYSVVVRNSTLAARYPGGVETYEQSAPNATFCSDGNLCRIGFMMSRDAETFIAQLAADGLTPHRDGVAEDVAFVSQFDGFLRPCDWLEAALYQGTPIAWLKGTDVGNLYGPPGWTPGRTVKYVTAAEAKERLEFLRSENGVDVYRDKTTGEELYVGRTAPEPDVARHDDLYQRARNLIEGLILLHNERPPELDATARQRLEDAIPLFVEVVQINPNNWPAMWLLGKVYQRLSDNERALEWFARAHRVNPDQPDVAREASIAAMDVSRPTDAIAFCERALQVKPDDPGLRANLALALLFSDRASEAHTVAAEALRRDPRDEITALIVRVIEEVLAGKRSCPHHVREVR